ncbi:predicted protein [Uncinocarpus reesii 1704]|uniref:Uncharacterized protein n=1 Tax=Uncinocarpus reesii (strain UAMH 1704) TaxID=336963 RepID=C4JJQ2_UNCRE|nr:uncharacterized protein UREG_01859 [Uncinocarpus reesii 1704]EEP77010.1 predicted protein [Uncinocarpus reesii 1704]
MMFLKSIFAAAVAFATVQASPIQEQQSAWQARHGLTSSAYESVASDLRSQGYRLNYVSGYTDDGAARYAAVWERRRGAEWTSTHNQDSNEFLQSVNRLRNQGYHPLVVNGYSVNGRTRYDSIWDKSQVSAWEARFDLDSSALQRTLNEMRQKGLRIVHLSGYAVGREARYSAIFERRRDTWDVRWGLNSAQYQDKTAELKGRGYRPTHVSTYNIGGNIYYAAIFVKEDGPAWASRHGLTSEGYQREFDELNKQGYMPKVVSGVSSGNSVRYAAIWEKV